MLQILLIIKFIIYTSLIKVQYYRVPIILISSLISGIILSSIYKSKSKHKRKYAFTFYSLVSLLMFINATYFAQFNNLTSINLIKLIPQLTTVGDSIKVLLDIKKILLIIDLPIILLCSIYLLIKRKILRKRGLHCPSQDDTIGVSVIPTAPPSVIPTVVEESQLLIVNRQLSIVNCIYKPHFIALALVILLSFYSINGTIKSIVTQELFTYHLLDIKQNLLPKENISETKETLSIEDIKELKARTYLPDGNLTGIGKGKNLIVIQVEGLQNFVIDLEYKGQEITPNLNRLIEDKSSVYYKKYYQLLGRGNTSDAEFVSHNSLHPSMEEPTYVQYANNTFYGLPWLLRDNQYTAWAFHGYKSDYWNRKEAYVNQGFQRFLSEEDFEFEDTIGFGLKDEDFFEQSLEYIKELDNLNDNPFYAFLITLTSHTPFNMPEEYQVLDVYEEYQDTMVGNYLNAIHYTDREIGHFIDGLKSAGLYDDTVIAIYGDHFAVLSTDEKEQQVMTDFLGEHYDFDNMMNIPLIIHVPDEEIHEIKNNIGSQLDFYPTISNIMGYKNEKGLIFGRDLNNYNEENYVFPQTYMLKGSVLTQDAVFEISRDGIFDHSRAYSIKTKKEIDIEKFKQLSEKAIKEINKSDYILKNDLLKELKMDN